MRKERQMKERNWIREFPAAITVCDRDGIILAMNDKSCATFAEEGGAALIGTNLLDCHPDPARTKVASLLSSGSPNVYTIEKGGIKKLIYQSPWYDNGTYAGFMELSLPIPAEIPHFIRDTKGSE
jgi:PAS domain-containing protein